MPDPRQGIRTIKQKAEELRKKAIYDTKNSSTMDRILGGVDDVLTAPQKAATWAVTGKYQKPSEAMGLDPNSLKGIAADAVLDPVNILPGVGMLGKFTKAGKLAAKAAKAAEAVEKVGQLRKLGTSLEGASNVRKVVGKAAYAAKGSAVSKIKTVGKNWKGITALTNDVLQPAANGKSASANTLDRVDKVASAPQKKMMKALTGKEQRPSEYLKWQDKIDPKKHPYLHKGAELATDVVLDPLNAIGAVTKGIKTVGKVGKMAAEIADGRRVLSMPKVPNLKTIAGDIKGAVLGKTETKEFRVGDVGYDKAVTEGKHVGNTHSSNLEHPTHYYKDGSMQGALKGTTRHMPPEESYRNINKGWANEPAGKTSTNLYSDLDKTNPYHQKHDQFSINKEINPIYETTTKTPPTIGKSIKTAANKVTDAVLGKKNTNTHLYGEAGYDKAAAKGKNVGTYIEEGDAGGVVFKDQGLKTKVYRDKPNSNGYSKDYNERVLEETKSGKVVEPDLEFGDNGMAEGFGPRKSAIYETTSRGPSKLRPPSIKTIKKVVTDKVLGKPVKKTHMYGEAGYEKAAANPKSEVIGGLEHDPNAGETTFVSKDGTHQPQRQKGEHYYEDGEPLQQAKTTHLSANKHATNPDYTKQVMDKVKDRKISNTITNDPNMGYYEGQHTSPVYETTSRNPPKLGVPKSTKTLAKTTPAHLIPKTDTTTTPVPRPVLQPVINTPKPLTPKVSIVPPKLDNIQAQVETVSEGKTAAPKVLPVRKVEPKPIIAETIEAPTIAPVADTVKPETTARRVSGFRTIKTASGHYKAVPKAESVAVPKSAIQAKFTDGTKSIKTMNGIKTKPRTEKEKLAARQAAFSPTDNARVAQLKQRSENGFKGERLNDHGLPLGENLGKAVPIIQAASMDTNNPESSAKFRKQKYADGTKGIKTKKGGMSNFINGEADKIKNMTDEDLKKATLNNMNFRTTKQNDVEKGLLDETVNRKWKKQGGYSTGTKSIKTKKGC